MRLLDVYLAGYFLLIAGAITSLYRSGVLQRLPVGWTVSTVLGAAAIGILLRLVSAKPPRPDRDDSPR